MSTKELIKAINDNASQREIKTIFERQIAQKVHEKIKEVEKQIDKK